MRDSAPMTFDREHSQQSAAAARPETGLQQLKQGFETNTERLSSMEATVAQLAEDVKARLPPPEEAEQVPRSGSSAQLSQEFQATLASLQQVLSTIASQPVTPSHAAGRSAGSQIQSVVDWTCNLGRRLVLQVDDTLVLLARHILIEPPPPGEPCSSCRPASQHLAVQNSVGRRVLAAGLFVAAVEAAWQLHVRCVPLYGDACSELVKGLRLLGLAWQTAGCFPSGLQPSHGIQKERGALFRAHEEGRGPVTPRHAGAAHGCVGCRNPAGRAPDPQIHAAGRGRDLHGPDQVSARADYRPRR